MSRRYLQGTLDFACAIYALINVLAHSHDLDLSEGRYIFQETAIALSEAPELWKRFMRNETDHYWLVRYMLGRWGSAAPWKLSMRQPFSDCLLPCEGTPGLDEAELFLPEKEEDAGPKLLAAARQEAASVWRVLEDWFSDDGKGARSRRTALLRFHRFLFHETPPVISHWTTARGIENGALQLHDASSEKSALIVLKKNALLPVNGTRGLIRIVPESLVLLEPAGVRACRLP